MYGTVARMRAKPGSGPALEAVMAEYETLDIAGHVATYLYRLDNGDDDYYYYLSTKKRLTKNPVIGQWIQVAPSSGAWIETLTQKTLWQTPISNGPIISPTHKGSPPAGEPENNSVTS